MDALCQFQADVLGVPVARAASAEATALGAAMLAAVGDGLVGGPEETAATWQPGPAVRSRRRHGARPSAGYAAWLDAIDRVRSRPVGVP